MLTEPLESLRATATRVHCCSPTGRSAAQTRWFGTPAPEDAVIWPDKVMLV
jgi:hypothetical protein